MCSDCELYITAGKMTVSLSFIGKLPKNINFEILAIFAICQLFMLSSCPVAKDSCLEVLMGISLNPFMPRDLHDKCRLD